MNILAVDTSGPTAGVAILMEGLLRYEATARNKMTHSVNLMPMVEEGLQKCGASLEQMDLLAVVAGPGSFTGVRIGVSAVKGMAMAIDTPCLGINALEALAFGVGDKKALLCPIRDARAGQVYGAAFRGDKRLMEDKVLMLPEYLQRIRALGETPLFVGDGTEPHRQAILETVPAASFAPAHLNTLKAGAAALLASQQRHQSVRAEQLAPLYLRKPQAQRERERKGG